ncbi:permease-like cell division protein FtsX [Micromonospora sp. 050-3]|uniref:permease-like cell division protein FtsX n=1 Tax=Micromonospora sp. 050-3 TaxID=2789265 RepID=UPI00397AFABC
MDQNLRVLFDRAVADEPELPLVDLVGDAVVAGTGLRRRRQRLVATGVAAVIAVAAVGAVNVATPPQRSSPPPRVPAAFGMLVNKDCGAPAGETATDAVVFLALKVTDQQRSAVNRALDADPAVGTVSYESREEALRKFKKVYVDAAELDEHIVASQLPESFRVRLAARSQYVELAARVERLPGVEAIIGIDCPAGTSASAVD